MGSEPNPFTLLGLPQRFDLGIDEIHAAHLGRIASIHPDLSQSGDDSALDTAAAALNDAKRILENPESRANALLQLLGGPTKEGDRSLPQDFLMEMMETREAIEAAVTSKDPAEIQRWRSWAQGQRGEHIQGIFDLFRSLPSVPTAVNLVAIRTRLNAWRYIERLIEQLDPAYHGLNDSLS